MEQSGQSLVAPIVLIGLPGTGKTSVGEILAGILAIPFFDSDRVIEANEKRTVARIFADDGEKHFRALECSLLDEFENAQSKSFVLSCGGGLPMTSGNMDRLLALGNVCYLKTAIEELMIRLAGAHDRPLLKGKQSAANTGDAPDEHVLRNRLQTLESEREKVYRRAQVTVSTDGLSTAQVAEKILESLRQ